MKRLLATLVGFMFTSVVLLALCFSMSMDEHGNMLDCPYAEGGSSMCAMTGLEDLAAWKMNFLALTQGQNLLLLSVSILSFFVWFNFSSKEELALERVKLKWRVRKNDMLKLLDAFALLLARGVLHPKVYQRA